MARIRASQFKNLPACMEALGVSEWTRYTAKTGAANMCSATIRFMKINVAYVGGPLEGRIDRGLECSEPPPLLDHSITDWVAMDCYYLDGFDGAFWRYVYRGP